MHRPATHLLSIFLLLASIASASDEIDRDIAVMLARTCREHDVPSLSIAVVRSDEVVATVCSGVRKRGTKDPVELSDRHPLGSNTKSMTATLAAVVVESGKIDWDTTISDVWPGATEKHLHPALRDVTLDELLSHQSGVRKDLGGAAWSSFFKERSKPMLERQRMLKLIMNQKPEHKRGEYHYSNLGYVIAATMLEKRAGQAYETMMRRDIFRPLKMRSADFRTMASAKKLKAPLLWGHRGDGEPISPKVAGAENPSAYASAGTVHVSIADYAKYAQWHLKMEPAPVLSKKQSLNHLHTGQIDRSSGGGTYGAGWIHLKTGLGRAMTHTGSNTNSFAVIWVLPDKDFAAIACTNTGEQSGFLACDKAIQELMKRFAN